MKSLRTIILITLALPLALGLTSCITTEETPIDDHPAPPPSLPSPRWTLHPDGAGYDLDVVVNGQEHHVDSGGEYMAGHLVRGNSAVPSTALSAYEVDMPDGEAVVYWIEPHGSQQLVVYSRFWDPMEGRHEAPKRRTSIRY